MREEHILVFGADLAWHEGVPVLGLESRRVCDTLVQRCERLRRFPQCGESAPRIAVFAAGLARNFNYAHLGKLMQQYFVNRIPVIYPTWVLCGPQFTTAGEARIFWAYEEEWRKENPDIRLTVSLVGRWFHLPRIYLTTLMLRPVSFWRSTEVRVIPVPSNPTRDELLHELKAWVVNIFLLGVYWRQ